MKSFESRGLWFLPEKPDNHIAGTLTFSVEEGIRLLLTGSLQDIFGSRTQTYPLVHGVVNDCPYGRFVSLVDCIQRHATLSIPGFASEELRANRGYIGAHHIGDETQASFETLRASFSNLSQWTGLTGFGQGSIEQPNPATILVRHSKPSPQEFEFAGRIVAIEVGVEFSRGDSDFAMKERPWFTVRSTGGESALDALRAAVFPFQDFLTFMIGRPAAVDDVFFMSRRDSDLEPIYMLFQPVYHSVGTRPIYPPEMLLTWPAIRSRSEVLSAWPRLRTRYWAACDLYFALQYSPPTYVEMKLLLAISALEIFLWIRSGTRAAPDLEQRLRALYPDQAVGGLHHAEAALAHLVFPSALAELLRDYRQLMAPIVGNDLTKLLTAVVGEIRHRFREAHESGDKASPLERVRLFEMLMLLTKAVMLEELALSRMEIAEVLSQAPAYAWLRSESATS